MDWLNILNELFNVCIVPLLGLATAMLIRFVNQKVKEGKSKTNSEIAIKYLDLLERTVVDCVRATNQTYVNALKEKNAFDGDAQKQALTQTTEAILAVLSDDAKDYLANITSDLETLVKEKIESTIDSMK